MPDAIGLKGNFERDEREQAEYGRDLLDVFSAEGVDAVAEWFGR